MSKLLLVWPVMVFAAIYWQMPWLGCLALLGLGAQFLWPALRVVKPWAVLGYALIVAVAVGLAMNGEPRVYLHSLPVLIFLLLALFFGRTLRGNSVPLVTRIAAAARHIELHEIHKMPAGLYRYTRRVTLFWTLGFVFFAVEDLILLQLSLPTSTAVAVNLGNFVVVAVLLVLEYLYHSRRYPNPSHRHIGDFLRDISRYDYRQLFDD